MWTYLVTVVLVVAVVVRLTRIVVKDRVSEPARMWLLNRRGPDDWLTYFVFCPWCVSVWLGVLGGVWVAVVDHSTISSWVTIPGVAALASYTTGWLIGVKEGDD